MQEQKSSHRHSDMKMKLRREEKDDIAECPLNTHNVACIDLEVKCSRGFTQRLTQASLLLNRLP
jgi:hypothetical protein